MTDFLKRAAWYAVPSAIAICAAVALASVALAHDDAQWIADGKYRASSGELCCGPTDCGIVPAHEVRHVPDGYVVRGYHVPLGEILPSHDGKVWACVKPGGLRCVFVPLMG